MNILQAIELAILISCQGEPKAFECMNRYRLYNPTSIARVAKIKDYLRRLDEINAQSAMCVALAPAGSYVKATCEQERALALKLAEKNL